MPTLIYDWHQSHFRFFFPIPPHCGCAETSNGLCWSHDDLAKACFVALTTFMPSSKGSRAVRSCGGGSSRPIGLLPGGSASDRPGCPLLSEALKNKKGANKKQRTGLRVASPLHCSPLITSWPESQRAEFGPRDLTVCREHCRQFFLPFFIHLFSGSISGMVSYNSNFVGVASYWGEHRKNSTLSPLFAAYCYLWSHLYPYTGIRFESQLDTPTFHSASPVKTELEKADV